MHKNTKKGAYSSIQEIEQLSQELDLFINNFAIGLTLEKYQIEPGRYRSQSDTIKISEHMKCFRHIVSITLTKLKQHVSVANSLTETQRKRELSALESSFAGLSKTIRGTDRGVLAELGSIEEVFTNLSFPLGIITKDKNLLERIKSESTWETNNFVKLPSKKNQKYFESYENDPLTPSFLMQVEHMLKLTKKAQTAKNTKKREAELQVFSATKHILSPLFYSFVLVFDYEEQSQRETKELAIQFASLCIKSIGLNITESRVSNACKRSRQYEGYGAEFRKDKVKFDTHLMFIGNKIWKSQSLIDFYFFQNVKLQKKFI